MHYINEKSIFCFETEIISTLIKLIEKYMSFVRVSTREKRNYDGVAREDKRVIYYGICGKQSNQISISALITCQCGSLRIYLFL